MATSAKESKHIQKTRKKLERVLEEEHKRFTEETLSEIRRSIYQWIDRHQPERISLKEKTVRLFGEETKPAAVKSKFVQHLIEKLEKELPAEEKKIKALKGRVKRDYKRR